MYDGEPKYCLPNIHPNFLRDFFVDTIEYTLGVAPSQQQWQMTVYKDSLLKIKYNSPCGDW